jgi:hypothetical protein
MAKTVKPTAANVNSRKTVCDNRIFVPFLYWIHSSITPRTCGVPRFSAGKQDCWQRIVPVLMGRCAVLFGAEPTGTFEVGRKNARFA